MHSMEHNPVFKIENKEGRHTLNEFNSETGTSTGTEQPVTTTSHLPWLRTISWMFFYRFCHCLRTCPVWWVCTQRNTLSRDGRKSYWYLLLIWISHPNVTPPPSSFQQMIHAQGQILINKDSTIVWALIPSCRQGLCFFSGNTFGHILDCVESVLWENVA